MSPPIIALVVVVLIAAWAVYTYNTLVHARNKVSEAFSGVDVQLRLRHDLVPNLTAVVRAYATHEQDVLSAAAAARSDAIAAQEPATIARAEEGLAANLTRVVALAEDYPSLKAAGDFQRLIEQLSRIEDEVQAARRIYNSNAEFYNSRAQAFPALVIANWMRPISFDYIDFHATDLAAAGPLVGEFAA